MLMKLFNLLVHDVQFLEIELPEIFEPALNNH